MPKNAKKPQIRFKGFTDAWEQRKLGEFGKATSGTSIEAEFLHEGKYKVINIGSYSEISQYIDQGIRVNKTEKIMNRILNKDDLTMILNDKTSKGNIIGRVLLIDADDTYVYNQRTERIEVYKDLFEPNFIYQLLNAENIRKKIISSAQGNTQIYINWSIISNFNYFVPLTKSEQKHLANFFDYFDNLITLHQRKLDKLKNIKKSMLEKMFPKNGSNIPEIRFKGFTDAWEQRKLGEIANKVLDKNIGLQYVETLTNSAEYGIISQREFFDHNISKIESLEGYYIVQNNDFVYNPRISTTAPVGPINRNKLGRSGVMSPLYTVFRVENVDFTFLEYFFKTNCWHAFMNYNGDSGARSDRFSIKDNIFFEMPIVIPRIEEQIKIGKYMLKLDNLITLHQRKLEKLQNIKKACLEKMFV